MPDDITEADEVRIEVDGIEEDCDVLADSLGHWGPLRTWPRFLDDGKAMSWLFCKVAKDAERSAYRITFHPPPNDDEIEEWSEMVPFREKPVIEIEIEASGQSHSRLRARSDKWCGSRMLHMLLNATDHEPFLRLAVGRECPALDALDTELGALYQSAPVRCVSLYVNTDMPALRMWLLRRTQVADAVRECEPDGSGWELIPGQERNHGRWAGKIAESDGNVEVDGWISCKRDARGINGGIRFEGLIRFDIEALSAHRCKVFAYLKDERYAILFDHVLVHLADDYPETRPAIEAAGLLAGASLASFIEIRKYLSAHFDRDGLELLVAAADDLMRADRLPEKVRLETMANRDAAVPILTLKISDWFELRGLTRYLLDAIRATAVGHSFPI